jgi:twitching motility protein PilT
LARIDAFLKLGSQQGCSDVHLAVGVPPMLRMNGDLLPIKFRDLRAAELEGYITEILTKSQADTFAGGHDLDFSYVSGEGARFRVNVYRKDTGVGATFRAIPSDVPKLEKLALPPIVTKLCDYHQGMILVTGSTGTGKSTTLAAMIDYLNDSRRLNIISLEDPIEFVHRSKQSQVIQRELRTHIPSFAEGVRAAMREDPDVILVGELRDAETISMAMTAAETGHLVLGTLHTTGAVKTIDRIIDALPIEEREQTKSFLAQSLLAVITQVLVKTGDARGRKAICEVMVMTKAVAKLIQSDQTHQIPNQLQTGRDLGMQLLDQALLAAVTAREVDPDDAYVYANEKRLFHKYVTDTSMLPKSEIARAPEAPAGGPAGTASAASG